MTALDKGKIAYGKLAGICDQLAASGNWQKIGTSDIRLFLDMYTQVLILRMAETGELTDELLQFAAKVPSRDLLRLGRGQKGSAAQVGFKNRSFAEGTPLLLRCCIASDDKDGTALAGEFVNGISSLLYAAAEADGLRNDREMQFITAYIGGLRTFLMNREAGKYTSRVFSADAILPGQSGIRRESRGAESGKDGTQESRETAPAGPEATEEDTETLEELLSELDALIGLTEVKKEVHDLVNLIKVREIRKNNGLKVMNMSFHMVFTGNPGTGKTTVARLIARIYRKLGFLSKGQLVETDRSGLVAGYVGQTAGKVTEVVNSALGGILFIDEAYSLARTGMENDFGREAIDTLVKLMEDHREDFLVIVAGYTQEMHDFLTSNPGLISRFNKYIDFPDYTDEELMQILKLMASRQEYSISEEAERALRNHLERMTIGEREDFGNARGMRNTLEKLVQAQSNRIGEMEEPVTKEILMEITAADYRAAFPGSEPEKEEEPPQREQAAPPEEEGKVQTVCDE